MHIIFHSITFKNLFSYGNVDTTISLDTHRNTIVTGKNGTGKSSGILDGVCYAIYNKPYRKVNLGQLVNSVNKKDLKVTVEFSIGTTRYKVVRGQKPGIFEIWKDGNLIKEEAASKDYQAVLENDIIGINYKTFKQIVVIGKATYVPFMNLTPAERRSITEDVLDISIFSSMLELAKQKTALCKSTIESLTYEIGLQKNQVESQKKLLDSLEAESAQKTQETDQQKFECRARISDLEEKILKADAILDALCDVSSKHAKITQSKDMLDKQVYKIKTKITDAEKVLGLYSKDTCPTCEQPISAELREEKSLEVESATKELREQLVSGQELLESFKLKSEQITTLVEKFNTWSQSKRNLEYERKSESRILEQLQVETKLDSIDMCRSKLKECVDILVDKTESKNTASKDIEYFKTCVEVLKDSGIKAKVIGTFIPVMNQLINEYLEKFDMFVSFELDEMFNETIKSRNRDAFSYNSFSEGEKAKIDLSILFAWRKIAMSRNSISSNLLIFDETLDQSLDEESVDIFISILGSIEETANTVVISHRTLIPELFDRHISVTKVRDFSVINIA